MHRGGTHEAPSITEELLAVNHCWEGVPFSSVLQQLVVQCAHTSVKYTPLMLMQAQLNSMGHKKIKVERGLLGRSVSLGDKRKY